MPLLLSAALNILLLPTLLLAAGQAFARDIYTVNVSHDLQKLTVNACFDGQAPAYLYRHRDAARFTEYLRVAGQERTTDSRRIYLRGMAKGECASWQVSLGAAARAGDYRKALQIESAIITAGSLWFWRDNERREIEVRMHLPEGVEFSAPWPLVSEFDSVRLYRPSATPSSWSSRMALGRFATRKLDLPGGQVKLAMLGNFDSASQDKVAQWIAEPARAIAGVLGQLPHPQVQVVVVGIGPRSSAVPWAHVLRGGGVAIELFADETRSLEQLRADWTATHEFSHLLLPYVASEDRWLSEGLASYFQNVLRARDGRLSEPEAWQKLLSGFERGQNDSRSGGTMDTYWRGASFLMQADSRLRAESKGRQSLDSALVALSRCCPDPGRRWPAAELLRKLDQLTGYTVFTEAYSQLAGSAEFPDPLPTLQLLGVNRQRGRVELDDDAPWSTIRQNIMAVNGASVVNEEADQSRQTGSR